MPSLTGTAETRKLPYKQRKPKRSIASKVFCIKVYDNCISSILERIHIKIIVTEKILTKKLIIVVLFQNNFKKS